MQIVGLRHLRQRRSHVRRDGPVKPMDQIRCCCSRCAQPGLGISGPTILLRPAFHLTAEECMSGSRRRRPSTRINIFLWAAPPPCASRCLAWSTAPAVVLEHVTRLRADLCPEWPQPAQPGGSYRIEISGELYAMDSLEQPPGGPHAGLVATAMRIVNAILQWWPPKRVSATLTYP